MKKILVVLMALILVGLGIWKLKSSKVVEISGKPIVKIGVTLPLTGNMATLGQPAKGTIEIARTKIEELNTKWKYQFVFEDNVWNPTKALTITNKLISFDKIDVLIDGGSSIGRLSSKKAEENRLIHFNVWSSDERVADGKYNFVNHTQPESEAKKLTEVVISKGYKNILIISANDEGCLSVARHLEKQLNDLSIRNNFEVSNLGTRDYRMQISKLMKNDYDLIAMVLWEPEINIFIKQLRELGYNVDLTAIEAIPFSELYLFEKQFYIDPAEGTGEIMDEIKAYNKSDNVYGLSQLYDSVMIIVEAFENSTTKEEALEYITNLKEYIGLSGKLLQDSRGIFNSEATLKIIKNSKPVIIEE